MFLQSVPNKLTRVELLKKRLASDCDTQPASKPTPGDKRQFLFSFAAFLRLSFSKLYLFCYYLFINELIKKLLINCY